jgi:hypothetical protein
MSLHDVQVVISASDLAKQYQLFNQQQIQVAQAQQAVILNAQSEIKKTQSQQMEEEQAAGAIDENEGRMRKWKKEHFNEGEGSQKKEDKPGSRPDSGHIIDIRA